MTRYKLTRNLLRAGRLWPAGSYLELDGAEAKELMARGLAMPPAATEASPAVTDTAPAIVPAAVIPRGRKRKGN